MGLNRTIKYYSNHIPIYSIYFPLDTKKPAKKKTKKKEREESENAISYDWAEKPLEDYVGDMVENGGKIALLMSMIEETVKLGEKLLVFSQSLFTLSLIEEYLGRQTVPLPGCTDRWTRNKYYFRK